MRQQKCCSSWTVQKRGQVEATAKSLTSSANYKILACKKISAINNNSESLQMCFQLFVYIAMRYEVLPQGILCTIFGIIFCTIFGILCSHSFCISPQVSCPNSCLWPPQKIFLGFFPSSHRGEHQFWAPKMSSRREVNQFRSLVRLPFFLWLRVNILKPRLQRLVDGSSLHLNH